jgi:hypothetical protein
VEDVEGEGKKNIVVDCVDVSSGSDTMIRDGTNSVSTYDADNVDGSPSPRKQ